MLNITRAVVAVAVLAAGAARADWNVDQIDEGKVLLVDVASMKTRVIDARMLPGVKEGDTLNDDLLKVARKRESFAKRIAKLRAAMKAEKSATAKK